MQPDREALAVVRGAMKICEVTPHLLDDLGSAARHLDPEAVEVEPGTRALGREFLEWHADTVYRG